MGLDSIATMFPIFQLIRPSVTCKWSAVINGTAQSYWILVTIRVESNKPY